MSRIRAIWAARAICIGLITGLAGGLVGWGINHHEGVVVADAVSIAVLATVVMLLNWRLND